MVEKMLGQKIGTGGSSGQGYLKETVDKHKVFTDLANIATLMISRSYLPKLPKKVKGAASIPVPINPVGAIFPFTLNLLSSLPFN